jgi:uncharacterized C2H2 Zn-finger protein
VSDRFQFVEARTRPVCPHCDEQLDRIEYTRNKVEFGGFLWGWTWVILLTCPRCHKVIGTQSLG